MRVRKIRLANFRNYTALDLELAPGLNILHGANAQGKSNVLEALALIATTRSLRAGRESELIERGCELAVVSAEVDREREGEADLQVCVLQTDKKTVQVNGLRRPRVIDLLGELNAVSFGAVDLAIVTGEPSVRRHYLNVEISQISPGYVFSLARYKRVLEQRNRLLRDLRDRPRRNADTGLEAWNEQLVKHGAPLVEKRRFFIQRLAPIANEIHRNLTDGSESLEVRYLPSISAEGGTVEEIERAFAEQLAQASDDEMRRGLTLIGPQRDDMAFLINGADARVFGSQGQQRTVTLSIKLAEYRLFEEYVGEPPILLLDDVMSDLDDARRRHLLSWIEGRGQTLITCTSLRSFSKQILACAATYHVVSGVITRDAREGPAEPAQPPEPPAEG